MQSLLGPYLLSEKEINNYVMSSVPGIFVTGIIRNQAFHPQWIGRADECINFRLKERLGKCSHFKFTYTLTKQEAFIKQCRLYHELLETAQLSEMQEHPFSSPENNYACPICGLSSFAAG